MVRESPAVDHRIGDEDGSVHYVWDDRLDPIRRVEPGDVVRFDCPDASDGTVGPETAPADLPTDPLDPGHALVGPVAVAGASPGDVLVVEILDVTHGEWGWTAHWPDKGLLADHFDEGGLHVWDLDGDVGHFVDGIEVPLDPFPGSLGVAPAGEAARSTIPPRNVGGNLDVKYLTAGSTAYLPVEVDGALFSVGDGHAAQGDGEVCLTGIETPISVTARLSVRSGREITQPAYQTDSWQAPGPAYATTGVDDDLMAATERAILEMVRHLERERGLTASQAYVLCSVAVDLRINQVVNAPNWTVSASLPHSLFPD